MTRASPAWHAGCYCGGMTLPLEIRLGGAAAPQELGSIIQGCAARELDDDTPEHGAQGHLS